MLSSFFSNAYRALTASHPNRVLVLLFATLMLSGFAGCASSPILGLGGLNDVSNASYDELLEEGFNHIKSNTQWEAVKTFEKLEKLARTDVEKSEKQLHRHKKNRSNDTKTIEKYEKQLAVGQKYTMWATQTLIDLYLHNNKPEEALTASQNLIDFELKHSGPDTVDYGRALKINADVLSDLNQYNKAVHVYEQASLILENALSADSSEVLAAQNDTAVALDITGKQLQARQIYIRVINIGRMANAKGPVMTALANLAGMQLENGNSQEAEMRLQEAISMGSTLEKNLKKYKYSQKGSYKYSLAGYYTALNIMGELKRREGKLELAETHLKKSLALAEAALPENHPNRIQINQNLAKVYREQGQIDLAKVHEANATYVYLGIEGLH